MYKLTIFPTLLASNLTDALENNQKPSKEGKSHEFTVGLNEKYSNCESNTLTQYPVPYLNPFFQQDLY